MKPGTDFKVPYETILNNEEKPVKLFAISC